jgi:hypothetical protein
MTTLTLDFHKATFHPSSSPTQQSYKWIGQGGKLKDGTMGQFHLRKPHLWADDQSA